MQKQEGHQAGLAHQSLRRKHAGYRLNWQKSHQGLWILSYRYRLKDNEADRSLVTLLSAAGGMRDALFPCLKEYIEVSEGSLHPATSASWVHEERVTAGVKTADDKSGIRRCQSQKRHGSQTVMQTILDLLCRQQCATLSRQRRCTIRTSRMS